MKPPWRGGDSWMGLSPFCTKHDSLEFSCCLRGAGTWLGTRLPGVAGRIELACAHDLVLSENKKYNGCICNHNASELRFEHQAVKIEWVKTCKHVKKDKKLESARIELATSPMLREHYTTKPWPRTAVPRMACFCFGFREFSLYTWLLHPGSTPFIDWRLRPKVEHEVYLMYKTAMDSSFPSFLFLFLNFHSLYY